MTEFLIVIASGLIIYLILYVVKYIKQPKRVEIIGADFAVEGSDYTAIVVIKNGKVIEVKVEGGDAIGTH